MPRPCAAILSLVLAAHGQTQPEAAPPVPTGAAPARAIKYENLPPAVQLGLRVEAIQNAWPTLPFVVIVPDTGSYIEAVAGWTPRTRFPVLIDDGSPAAREDIARFIRGFKPSRTYRWAGTAKAPEAASRRDAANKALLSVWSRAAPGEDKDAQVQTQAELITRWQAIGVPRTGIVIASHDDPAWTAALALAAGRAQPLAWIDRPPKLIDASFTAAELRSFEGAIESACRDTGLTWKALGDDIDAVAICLGIPGRVQSGNILAMTDVVARAHTNGIDGGDRWAWAGQISGTEARAAYAAMCSLFLGTHKAWLFDGYGSEKPWTDYDAGAAAEYLNRASLSTSVDDSPRGGERSWRLRASVPIDAGLIAVNTKGLANEFHLEPGRCVPGDVPILGTPAILYLVHSWSALSPIDRGTVGGRWIERGVYAYLGSVDEPYLQAFIPTPIAMGRFASKFPFAAAVRPDDRPGAAKAWKLTVLGDPLTMLARGVPRVEEALPLEGAVDLQDDLQAALDKKDFAAAVRALLLQGRDADLADLVRAVLNEKPETLTPAAAEDAVLPLFRRAEPELMARVYELLPAQSARRPDLRDALWLAAYRSLPATRDEKLVSVLRANIREDVRARDAEDLADAFAAVFGHKAAASMLAENREKLSDSGDRTRIDSAIRRQR